MKRKELKGIKGKRKQDRRTQIRILTQQGCWDPVGTINRINELAKQYQSNKSLQATR